VTTYGRLVDLIKNGIHIRVISGQSTKTLYGKMYGTGFAFQHNKVVIVDDTHVLTGSYDPTVHSNCSHENAVLLKSAKANAKFDRQFATMWKIADEF
jgi:phosphatidylserine/phosphatidylglycerophosphate/cardiolipin synthase-like enzyme